MQLSESQLKVARACQQEWDSYKDEGGRSPYEILKGIDHMSGVINVTLDENVHSSTLNLTGVHGVCTLVPLQTTEHEFSAIQALFPEKVERGDKKTNKTFPKGASMHHSFFRLGTIDPEGECYLTEGYATSVSVKMAMPSITVIFAQCAGNLKIVGEDLREKYPKLKIHVLADNDLWSKGNPGKKAAEDTVKITGGKIYYPIFKPDDLKDKSTSDFNDMHRLYSLSGVRLQYENKNHSQSQEKPLALHPISAYDLMRRPAKNYNWILEGIFAEGSLNLVAANSTAGKSVLMRQCAVCIARGEPFLERKTRKGKVLWLAMEEGEAYIRMHIDKIKLEDEAQKQIDFLFPEDFDEYIYQASLLKKRLTNMDALESFCRKHKPSIVFVDTLIYFTHIKNTNDYGEVSYALSPYKKIARETGTAIVLLHHMSKAPAKKEDKRSGMNRVMGSEAFNSATNVTMGIEVEGEAEERWIWAKGRTDLPLAKKRLHWDSVKWWGTLGGSKTDEAQAKKNASVRRALSGVKEEDAINFTALKGKVDVGKDTLNTLLECVKGEVWFGCKVNPKNKNSKLYYEKTYESSRVAPNAQY